MKPRYVGLDVHKRVVEACILREDGEVLERERFALTRDTLERFAKKKLAKSDAVALEATTNTWAVVGVLEPFVGRVVVSNPLRTKAIAEAKVKTDRVDAFVLAQLLRCDYLPDVWQPDERTRRMRQETHFRAALISNRTALKNRIHSVLAQRLIEEPVRDIFSGPGLQWLKAVTIDAHGRRELDASLRMLERVQSEIREADGKLAEEAWEDDRVKLLMTLPGFDVAVAQGLLAALGDPKRFKSADKAANYVGLTPSTRQSADHCYHGPITKAGNGHARWLVIQAAQHAGKHPGPLGQFFERIKRKKNHNVAVVAVARKLVTIAWHMLVKNEPYRYAVPRSTETKLARLRVRATGEKRKTGPKKHRRMPLRAGETGPARTIKPLAQIYREEGLPALGPPSPGEVKHIRGKHLMRFAQSIEQKHVEPR